ncbi:hypothetical protein ACUNHD_10575, partial [Serratia sp. IR-2025]
VCGKKIGPDPRNFNQRVSLGRNDLLIRTFPKEFSEKYIKAFVELQGGLVADVSKAVIGNDIKSFH